MGRLVRVQVPSLAPKAVSAFVLTAFLLGLEPERVLALIKCAVGTFLDKSTRRVLKSVISVAE